MIKEMVTLIKKNHLYFHFYKLILDLRTNQRYYLINLQTIIF